MDVVYFVQHSQHEDSELRYSLRSVAEYLPWIRKVWIFGDRPKFLSTDWSTIEHVSWEQIAWIGRFKTPVKNFFLQLFMASLWPELDFEFLVFCDDYIVLDNVSPIVAKRIRYLENLDDVKVRGTGMWKQSLWRTYDWLKQMGYPGYNFVTHSPTFMTKRRVFDAYADLEDFVTEDRFAGMLSHLAILNHAYRQRPVPLTSLTEEGIYAGVHDHPASYDEISRMCVGKSYLNFDDICFTEDMRRFLAERFPTPCVFESSL
jgi:hypothetical protein